MSKKPKDFACDCGKAFRSVMALADHARDAHGEVHPLDCPICGKRFGTSAKLENHRLSQHALPVGRRPTLTEIEPPVCLECGGSAELVDGKRIYPHRPDLYAKRFYLCACGAYCGCHPGSVVPLGHPCGPETRRARSAAHAAFDPLWKRGTMNRHQAYAWLSDATGIARDRCHIGMMTADQARLVVEAVETRAIETAVDQLVREGKVTRHGDRVTLTPEYHQQLRDDAEQVLH